MRNKTLTAIVVAVGAVYGNLTNEGMLPRYGLGVRDL